MLINDLSSIKNAISNINDRDSICYMMLFDSVYITTIGNPLTLFTLPFTTGI